MDPIPWREAWQAALYGPAGFYRAEAGPSGHFTTSTHGPLGGPFAQAVLALADAEHATHIVDVGAGRGELLTALHALRPGMHLSGVDLVHRPAGLPEDVTWRVAPGGAALPPDLRDLHDVLVVAHEWLDVVPCTVAQLHGGRLVEVLVDPATGEEAPGGALRDDEARWCARYWPTAGLPDGARVEVGLSRDTAWADLVSRVARGTVLAVDYGHDALDRPLHGTLTGYRAGTQVPPVPDGSCDVTAHVALDSLAGQERRTQREALHDLGIRPDPPPHAMATTDPSGYLAGLARSSAIAALTDPDGLGRFGWVLTRVPPRGPRDPGARCGRLTP